MYLKTLFDSAVLQYLFWCIWCCVRLCSVLQNEKAVNRKGLPKQQQKTVGNAMAAPEGTTCSECGIVPLIWCLSESSVWASVPRVSSWHGWGWTWPLVPCFIWRIQGKKYQQTRKSHLLLKCSQGVRKVILNSWVWWSSSLGRRADSWVLPLFIAVQICVPWSELCQKNVPIRFGEPGHNMSWTLEEWHLYWLHLNEKAW